MKQARTDGPAKLTRFDAPNAARMVDIGDKPATQRVAVGSGTVKQDNLLGFARIAAMHNARRTSGLIPLCQPIALTKTSTASQSRTLNHHFYARPPPLIGPD